MKKLLFGGVLVGDELNVIHQPDIDAPIPPLECLLTPLSQRGNEVRSKRLARDIGDASARRVAQDLLPDRVQEVGLAEPHAAVEEEWVVMLPRPLRHRDRRRVREAVARADHEMIERILVVQRQRRKARGRLRRLTGRRGDGDRSGATQGGRQSD
jgi:hypothetical protein